MSMDCLAEMYGDLCDEIYRRWISGFGGAGGWETRFDMAVDAGLDCLEQVPGAMDVVMAAEGSGDARIARHRVLLRTRLVGILAREYDGDADDPPELHFEFLLGAISRTVLESLLAGESLLRVRERVRTAITLLEPAAA
jgi:hypothetical protein